jgi:hypothetical protein
MGIWRFVGTVFRLAFFTALGITSTAATFLLAALGIGLLVLGVGGDALSWFLVIAPFPLLLLIIGAGMFHHAHALYKEQYNQREAAQRQAESERKALNERLAEVRTDLSAQISELQGQVLGLQEQLANPKKHERLTTLREHVERAQVFLQWFQEPRDSELFGQMRAGLLPWDNSVREFLAREIPGELGAYLDGFGVPNLDNQAEVYQFLQRKHKALLGILARVDAKSQPAASQVAPATATARAPPPSAPAC